MKSCVVFLLLFLAAATQTFGQTPTPSPKPNDSDVVKISTNLIRLDVTVLDARGKPIADLRPDEIELYENGQKQKITGLTFISGAARQPAVKPEQIDKGAIAPPPTQLKAEQVRRTFALVVDDLTLSFESAYQTRRALKKFVDEQMVDGDLVAIIRTGAGIGALQQFTSDKRILYAAIEKVKWNPLGNGGISAFAPLQSVLPADPDAPEPEAGERTAEGVEREFNDFRESYFATGALGALEYVVNGMSELPGRKSVVFFSEGFALTNTNAEGFAEGSRSLDPIQRLIENANRASVIVYSIDPRGLVYTGLTAADDTSGRTAQDVDAAMSERRTKLNDTQASLRYISEETGGFALVNNNDITGGIGKVLEDQSYYLVTYEPDTDTFDAAKLRFNKIDVKVLRAGAKARYRSGFFNVADREKPPPPANANPTLGQLEYALVSPFSVSGINLRLNALFGNDTKGVSYVRSLLHVNAADLKFTDADNGQKKAVFEVLAMSFGDNGQPVDQLGKSYTLTVKPDAYKRMLSEGFVYHFLFPVKKPGAYQYRVAIRDTQGGKLGSASQFIEVPDLKKKRLTISSVVIENLSEEAWRNATSSNTATYESNPMTDTALRRVKIGSVMRFGFEVYNAKLDQAKQPRLTTRIRVFSDGKLVLDGKTTPIELLGQTDLQHLRATRAISLGSKMIPGDYILQVIVTDESDPKKPKTSTQALQFEIVG
ncbi:MAG TPA: VWA domain-containing protein [Pyrinomonadaceae bacterium]|nr:VWA domain-containing protein [Acidobacteriota bacterium]HQZ95326.1 VWA domain-containing protein [Pyrinomonadaceae bacterium]